MTFKFSEEELQLIVDGFSEFKKFDESSPFESKINISYVWMIIQLNKKNKKYNFELNFKQLKTIEIVLIDYAKKYIKFENYHTKINELIDDIKHMEYIYLFKM